MQTIELRPGDSLTSIANDTEVTGVDLTRTTDHPGSSPPDIAQVNVDFGVETRHVTIHDVHNVGWWAWRPGVVQDARLYDVVVYNVGWRGLVDKDRPDGGHGMALYTQNYANGGHRLIDTCVFMAGFSLPGKVYGTNSEVAGGWSLETSWPPDTDGICHTRPLPSTTLPGPYDYSSPRNKLANYTIRHSIFTDRRFIIGNEGKSVVGAHNIIIEDSAFLNCWLQFGYQGDNGDGKITGTFLSRGVSVQTDPVANGERTVDLTVDGQPAPVRQSWANLEFRMNTVLIPAGASVSVVYPGSNWKWDDNEYWSEVEKPFVVTLHKGFEYKPVELVPGVVSKLPHAITEQVALTFDEWRALTGFDAHSIYHQGLSGAGETGIYDIPEKNEAIAWEWSSTSAQRPATGNLYPPPAPLNWAGDPPNVEDARIGVWRETIAPEPVDCSECETALATALARIAQLEGTLADREQRIGELNETLRERDALIARWQPAIDAIRTLKELTP